MRGEIARRNAPLRPRRGGRSFNLLYQNGLLDPPQLLSFCVAQFHSFCVDARFCL
jgi:hypothetical protein